MSAYFESDDFFQDHCYLISNFKIGANLCSKNYPELKQYFDSILDNVKPLDMNSNLFEDRIYDRLLYIKSKNDTNGYIVITEV
jgi:hypothetical protein